MSLFHNRRPEKPTQTPPPAQQKRKEDRAAKRDTRVRDRGFDMQRKPFEEGQ